MHAATFFVVFLLTQSAAQPALGQIAGRVVDAATNAPIAGARLVLLPAGPRSAPFGPPLQAVSDANGHFAFEQIAPGSYRVDVQKSGYVGSLAAANGAGSVLQLVAGQPLDNLTIALHKGGVIAGRVLDAAGAPLPDVQVTALRRMPAAGGRLLPAGGQSQQTNDIGEFRVAGLPAGEYYVAAMPRPTSPFGGRGGDPNTASTATTPKTTMATTFYPGTTDQLAAHAIAVTAGAETPNIVFTIQSAPAFRVSGIVVDEAGNPVDGAMVTMMSDPRGGVFMGMRGGARSGADGQFSITEVSAGNYRVMASIPMTVRDSGGGFTTWTSSGGSGNSVSVSGSASIGVTGGVAASAAGPTEPPTEVIVTDADITGVRVVVRRPRQ